MRVPASGRANSSSRHTTSPRASPYPRPVQARTTVRGVILLQFVANTAGGVVILIFLRFILPLFGGTEASDIELNLLILGAYLGVSVFIALPVNKHILHKAMGWVREGREPTDVELEMLAQEAVSAFDMRENVLREIY